MGFDYELASKLFVESVLNWEFSRIPNDQETCREKVRIFEKSKSATKKSVDMTSSTSIPRDLAFSSVSFPDRPPSDFLAS